MAFCSRDRLTLRPIKWSLLAVLTVLYFTFFAISGQAQSYTGPRMTYVYDGPKVSFEQLYENPDDRELNLNYARQQSARGDLLGASAALERLLFSEPNWHSARLYYAAVLYRLDDKKAAYRELELLSGSTMTEQQRQIYSDYGFTFQYTPAETASAALTSEEIAQSRAAGTDVAVDAVIRAPKVKSNNNALFNGRIAAGIRTDSNAGNALIDVGAGLTDSDDNSAFLIGAVQGQAPLSETGLQIFGSLNGQVREHSEFSRADFSTIGGHGGVFKDAGAARISVQMDADMVSVAGSKYLTQTGSRLTLSTHSNPDLRASVSVGHYDQSYNNLSATSNDRAASGDKTVILGRITKRLNAKLAIGGIYGLERKDAAVETLSYDAVRMGANFQTGENNGWQLRGQVTHRKLSFKGNSSVDLTRINARLGLSAPLDLLMKRDVAPGVRVEAAINHSQRNADSGGADFDNTGAELRVIWDF